MSSVAPNLTYRIELREDRLRADSIIRVSIDVARLRRKIDQAVRRGSSGGKETRFGASHSAPKIS